MKDHIFFSYDGYMVRAWLNEKHRLYAYDFDNGKGEGGFGFIESFKHDLDVELMLKDMIDNHEKEKREFALSQL